MDEYSGKKAGDGLAVSRKGSSIILRDTANNRDRNAQFCNRIGCSGRLNSAKGTQISCSEKAKSSRPSFRSSTNGKEIIGSSSRTYSPTNNSRKSLPGPRKKLSSQPERDSSETGGSPDDNEVPELVSPPGKIQKGLHSESDDSGSSENTSMEVGTSSISNTRSRKGIHRKAGFGKPDTSIGSPVSLLSKNTSQAARAGAGRYGLGNLRCSSISDAVSTGSSTSDSKLTRQKDTIRKRICEGESSSSARGKKISGSSLEGRNISSSSGISISDSRRTRNGTSSRDNGPASVRTPRSFGYTRSRAANQGRGNNLPPNEPHVIPQMSQPIMPINSNSPSSSHQFSLGSPLSRSRAYGLPSSTNESLRGIRPSSPAEVGNIRSAVNRESFRRYNMDGIAEVLLALERIEHDEELSYEQLLVLETSMFLNGLNFYDQHRDMRLDIDNMSYEELLALEERMGNVSTALTEEALSECLKTSIFQSASLEDASSDLCGEKDDVKCSICQEEYTVGDEMGRLQCEHRYHVACVQQWLRLKNWCPICKASAAPSTTSPPLSPNQ
ncbi:E3 ubiquitin-protein ligase MBR2 [Ricinus communis]|uniref:RING-type E3 ubiquitin transferase n=1 Tax=Ricinus communis TaxID=3988 RepID=B9RNL9_RICCO|nr:E3 ubiquitin-protein ligase MBR2 [Ricinus communis]XP_015572582.1 E3 ubiquitin-protein ligase MBR2 [Ricinus communis]EEF46787.1 ring finger protein, putative [Ricinus communis]|eukprot:XP_002515338.1 E3 ubiquitin-protein ligase MBR2 [Ricinus communis]